MSIARAELGHTLLTKIMEELRHPSQFFNSERRAQLAMNCYAYLRAMRTDATLTAHMETPERYVLDDGTRLHTCLPLVGVVFPERARIFYSPGKAKGKLSKWPDFVVSTTTTKWSDEQDETLPEEGYRDSIGVKQPFKQRESSDREQHGGFFVDSKAEDGIGFNVLSYSELLEAQQMPLLGGQAVIEANWYMDSANQERVCARPNMIEPRPYNCIGIITRQDGKQSFFTINTAYISIQALAKKIGFPNIQRFVRPVTLHEIALMANILVAEHNGISWRVGGLEFNGGGTFPGKEPPNNEFVNINKHHFRVYTS